VERSVGDPGLLGRPRLCPQPQLGGTGQPNPGRLGDTLLTP
jgi:hypothetical protein